MKYKEYNMTNLVWLIIRNVQKKNTTAYKIGPDLEAKIKKAGN